MGSKGASWDGVRNYQAAKNLKSMRIGDQCFFYHSNIGKEIVGIVEITKEAYLDKTDKTGRFVGNSKFTKLDKSITLEELKNEIKPFIPYKAKQIIQCQQTLKAGKFK